MQNIIRANTKRELPAYTHCMHATFQERLACEGMDLDVSLIANLCLHGLPSFKHRTHAGVDIRVVNRYDAMFLGYREFTDSLGVLATSKEFATFAEGMTYLQNSLQDGIPLLVFGSLYYLPYSASYQSQEFIDDRLQYFMAMANHWLLVNGLSEQAVHVYDPIPARFDGELALADFERFWKGDKFIPELVGRLEHEEMYWSFGYVELEIQEPMTAERLQLLSVSALKTIAYEFLTSQVVEREALETIYYGAAALQKLIAEVEWLEEHREDENWQQLADCVFEMRSIHLLVRDQLQQMVERFGNLFAEWQEAYLPIANEWMKLGNSFQLQIMRDQKEVAVLQRLRQRIDAVAVRETVFYQKLLNEFPDVSLLCKEEVEVEQSEE